MIQVRIDSLPFVSGEAIAWPVTALLGATTPLLRRLEIAGGRTLAEQLKVQDPLPVGSAVVTAAGELGVELLVNAVVTSETEPVSRAGVRRAIESALERAADWRIGHLVWAPFGLGAGNLALEDSAAIMIDVLTGHRSRARYPEHGTIVVETELEEEMFLARLAPLRRIP